jgi:hypothetical protein
MKPVVGQRNAELGEATLDVLPAGRVELQFDAGQGRHYLGGEVVLGRPETTGHECPVGAREGGFEHETQVSAAIAGGQHQLHVEAGLAEPARQLGAVAVHQLAAQHFLTGTDDAGAQVWAAHGGRTRRGGKGTQYAARWRAP